MPTLPALLITATSCIVGLLGLVHLVFTFHGRRFHPRDAELERRLKEALPVITRQTTMWKAAIGFHASHSLGAIFFGLVYGYLALVHGPLLLGSTFLLALGALMLGSYVVLARRYWFSTPLRGISLATLLYLAAIVAARLPAG